MLNVLKFGGIFITKGEVFSENSSNHGFAFLLNFFFNFGDFLLVDSAEQPIRFRSLQNSKKCAKNMSFLKIHTSPLGSTTRILAQFGYLHYLQRVITLLDKITINM